MDTTLKRPTSVRFKESVYRRVQEAAEKDNRSVSNWIEMAVIAYLDSEPNETTRKALSEAEDLRKAYEEGRLKPETVDLSSVDSMLSSLGV